MSIGQRIKERRLQLGMTQKQLGELCGMADSAIRKYESGKIIPKRSTIKKITLALTMSEMELYEGETFDEDTKKQILTDSLSNLQIGTPADRNALIETLSVLPDAAISELFKSWLYQADEMKKKYESESK